jgi:hypothetical protein
MNFSSRTLHPLSVAQLCFVPIGITVLQIGSDTFPHLFSARTVIVLPMMFWTECYNILLDSESDLTSADKVSIGIPWGAAEYAARVSVYAVTLCDLFLCFGRDVGCFGKAVLFAFHLSKSGLSWMLPITSPKLLAPKCIELLLSRGIS